MKKLYIIHLTDTNHYKIGLAINPQDRLKQLQTSNSQKLEIFYTFDTKFPFKLESTLHRIYGSKRLEGEWFEFTDPNDLLLVKENIAKLETNFEYLSENNTLWKD